jgi:hypothetical protein
MEWNRIEWIEINSFKMMDGRFIPLANKDGKKEHRIVESTAIDSFRVSFHSVRNI